MSPLADFIAQAALAANPLVLPFALLCGLVSAAVAVSFVALFRAGAAAEGADLRAREDHKELDAGVESLRSELTRLAAEIRELREQPPVAFVPNSPKPGLNLNKRSQALRMHRHGDAPAEIAASLAIPLQEVDLLLKVHRIVINNI